jgi:polar amino acid transport system substrate-binding protein
LTIAAFQESQNMTPALRRRGLAGAAVFSTLTFRVAVRAQASEGSTFDRVRGDKVLRIAVLPEELPYFVKDIAAGEWSGACIDMMNDIAKVFNAQPEYVESTYGNSVLDLQSNKVDLAFALNRHRRALCRSSSAVR